MIINCCLNNKYCYELFLLPVPDAASSPIPSDLGVVLRTLLSVRAWVRNSWTEHRRAIRGAAAFTLLVVFATYFCLAMIYSFGDEGSVRLLWFTCAVIAIVAMKHLKRHYRERLSSMTGTFLRGYLNVDSDILSWWVICYTYLGNTCSSSTHCISKFSSLHNRA